MPLMNRVDPFGDIHAVEWRGMFTGNRGVIHDPETKTLLKRRWTTKAWIVCECEFKGVKREPMGRNARSGGVGWTELFFLDEVTALAAGHRPCFTCRRERASDFLGHFGEALGIEEPRAPMLDKRLHKERLTSSGSTRRISAAEIADLPDGAMVADGSVVYAVRDGEVLPWSFAGYHAAIQSATLAGRPLTVITPSTTVAVLAAGYKPVWHKTGQCRPMAFGLANKDCFGSR